MNGHRSVVGLNDLFGDRQPDAGAVVLCGKEWTEDFVQIPLFREDYIRSERNLRYVFERLLQEGLSLNVQVCESSFMIQYENNVGDFFHEGVIEAANRNCSVQR